MAGGHLSDINRQFFIGAKNPPVLSHMYFVRQNKTLTA